MARSRSRKRIDWTSHLPENLTSEQRDIYTLIVREAASNEEIADTLAIKLRNVRYHVSKLLKATECTSKR